MDLPFREHGPRVLEKVRSIHEREFVAADVLEIAAPTHISSRQASAHHISSSSLPFVSGMKATTNTSEAAAAAVQNP